MTLALRMLDDGDALIEGWAVPFTSPFAGNRDLYQTVFDGTTNFHLDWYATRPLTYAHGRDAAIGLTAIGTVRAAELRDEGVWAEAQISQKAQYFRTICDMVRKGELQFSSGTIDYMMQVDSRSGHVDEWPLAELTLTPVPANPDATVSIVEDYGFGDFRAACRSLDIEIADLEAFVGDHAGSAQIVHAARAATSSEGEEAAREEAPANRAAVGNDPIETERSFEDIRADIEQALNTTVPGPYGGTDHWTSVIGTYPAYVVVARYCSVNGCCDEDPSYWRINYTLDDDAEPVLDLASQQPLAQVYVPVATSDDAPLVMDARSVTRHAETFGQRTKDLAERRALDLRPFSHTNRHAVEGTLSALDLVREALAGVLTQDHQTAKRAAEAAYWADPAIREAEIRVLELEAFVLGLTI